MRVHGPDPAPGTSTSRRLFLGRSVAAATLGQYARAALAGETAPRAPIAGVEHIKVHGDKATYCGHPRQCGMFHFGRGEIALMHNHAPCAYRRREDVQHGVGGYHGRAAQVLQRSTDGGRTWPKENEVVVWDESAPAAQRKEFLLSALTSPRKSIDLSRPESAAFIGRTFLGPDRFGAPPMVAFGLRSANKGRTWEEVPTLILPPPGCYSATPDNTPMVRLGDGTWLFPMRVFGGWDGVALYASTDNGLSWQFRTRICQPHDYPALVLLEGGRLQCYNYPLGLSHSDDGGKTWSERRPIVPPGPSPWADDDPLFGEPLARRSPTPLLLRDGRILILFARRIGHGPGGLGMGGIVSEDRGRTWSPDFILRNDASPSATTTVAGARCDYSDIGYPLLTELDDGRIFAAYYYIIADGNAFGGSRFIAGSFFRLS